MKLRTVDDVIAGLGYPKIIQLPTPAFSSGDEGGSRIALAVPSMARHMTDEGWQLMLALEAGGYALRGHGLGEPGPNGVSVPRLLEQLRPAILVLQDKREWTGRTAGRGFDQRERFTNVEVLRDRPDIFKLTVLKDAQHDPLFHRESAEEIGCHAWITYYHPSVVAHLAPYVRPQHLIRTRHTLNRDVVPLFLPGKDRRGVLLSGAVSPAYPLRTRLLKEWHVKPGEVEHLLHPGYGRRQCHTPQYLWHLNNYKVAVCTSSKYGYALRKLMEATACGCRVITDLPTDEVLPGIDGNLHRVSSDATVDEVAELAADLGATYDDDAQRTWATSAQMWYDYRAEGVRLATAIEEMRRDYNDHN